MPPQYLYITTFKNNTFTSFTLSVTHKIHMNNIYIHTLIIFKLNAACRIRISYIASPISCTYTSMTVRQSFEYSCSGTGNETPSRKQEVARHIEQIFEHQLKGHLYEAHTSKIMETTTDNRQIWLAGMNHSIATL